MSEDYDTRSDRALDCAVAEKIMGWRAKKTRNITIWIKPDGNPWGGFAWNPSGDDNAARLVRDRLAERGLGIVFAEHLLVLNLNGGPMTVEQQIRWHIWKAMEATPRQQMIAALRALGDTDGR